jgi:GMP synthase PP-ATPase subunit
VQEEIRGGPRARDLAGFAVLLPVRSVGVMGDERTYENGGGGARGAPAWTA